MMRPRFLLVLALCLCACRRAEMAMPNAFPSTVGEWNRTSLADLPAAQPPDAVPAASIERIRAAAYEGQGKLDARIYQLTNSAVALDVAQRWTPAGDTVTFPADRFFVVVKWQAADRKALQGFLRELEKRFPAKKE